QFSTTTKLSGLVWFNVTGAGSGGNVNLEGGDLQGTFLRNASRTGGVPTVSTVTSNPQITFSQLVWLNLSTSFTGKDQLVTQLSAGNGVSPANVYASSGLFNTFGVPFTDQTAGTTNGTSNFILHELFYSFPASDSIQFTVGPRVNWYRHFDSNRYTFFLFGAGSFNSIGSTLSNAIDRGSGAVVSWNINKQFKLNIAYLGENTEFLPAGIPGLNFNTASNPNFGLFGGTNTATAELTYSPSSNLNIRLLYNRTNLQASFGQVGGAAGEPIYGFADDGVTGGGLSNASANTFSANFDYSFSPKFGIFGRYSFSTTDLYRTGGAGRAGTISAQAFQLGVGFPDLGKPGALAVISYLVPFSVTDGGQFLVAGFGNGGKQYEIEASYYYPLTDNIAIVPSFYLIGAANNFSNNPSVYVGNLRTQFSF
ncbi:MAG: iron uptake porin, partial [Leptolyngbyaceae bacterium]|nr:iron uptake porin [Leptolyngbyaceae bacterium]